MKHSESGKHVLPRKDLFDIPENIIYLDGNSLGPLPKGVSERVATVVKDEWGKSLIKGWNDAGWMNQPSLIGDMIGGLIGAPKGSVVIGDTLSIKVYQALAAALQLRPERKVVLSDSGNFPTDLYMAQGLLASLNEGHELRVVDPEEILSNLDETIAAVMLTEVDYRTGRKHQMEQMTAKAHDHGAVMIWDLAHSAGAVPVDLAKSKCEFAVGCTYKYLNGGPGAPAFIYVRPDLSDIINPALSGWLGHDAPFAFERDYRPAQGIERMRVGTPPVLQMAALQSALSVWEGVDMFDIRKASIALSERFIVQVESKCPQLKLASPRNPEDRGSQVSFAFEHGYAAMQALIERGVIGDFRAPNIMRFGFTPLYLDEKDIDKATDILKEIMDGNLWDNPKYQKANRVT